MSLLDALRAAVGAVHVIVDGDRSAYELDWRKRFRGRALAIVRPGSTDEVAAVVSACRAHGASIVPQGGNTGLVGGSVPDESGTQVLLSLGRMNRIRSVDQRNLTLVAEAGCILQAVQSEALAHDLMFALSLAAEGSCTIGGNLATNAGGTQVLRYGNARELCLGVAFGHALQARPRQIFGPQFAPGKGAGELPRVHLVRSQCLHAPAAHQSSIRSMNR